MRLKIIDETTNEEDFEDLEIGDFFEYESEYFLKIEDCRVDGTGRQVNALNFSANNTVRFSYDTKVSKKSNAQLTFTN